MPAGLLPPRREKLFSDTSSRYLEPVHRDKPQYVPPERTHYDTQRAWANTNSRWGDQKNWDPPEKKEQPKPDTTDPLAAWDAAADHRRMALRAIGNVGSKFEQDAQEKGHPALSPRDRVTKKDESSKMERNWRGTHALNKHTTFDVMYAKWLKKHQDERFMQRKKNSARSPIADFIRNGTPIESSRGRGGGSPARAQTPAPVPDSTVRRASSPWERSVSPDTFIGGRWKGAGVTNTSFDRLKRQSVKMQPQMAQMEQHAHDVVAHVGEKKVDKSFVPRVYSLSLAMQIPESVRSSSRRDDSSYGPMYSIGDAGSRSPSRSPSNRRKASPTRRL